MTKPITVAKLSTLQDGKGMCVKVGEDLEISLFKVDGDVYAIEERCAHQGGPLSEGEMKGFIVTCPWHGMTYDIRTGEAAPGAWDQEYAVKSYNVKIEGDEVSVEV